MILFLQVWTNGSMLKTPSTGKLLSKKYSVKKKKKQKQTKKQNLGSELAFHRCQGVYFKTGFVDDRDLDGGGGGGATPLCGKQ